MEQSPRDSGEEDTKEGGCLMWTGPFIHPQASLSVQGRCQQTMAPTSSLLPILVNNVLLELSPAGRLCIMSASARQGLSWVAVTETVSPTKPDECTPWPFTEYPCWQVINTSIPWIKSPWFTWFSQSTHQSLCCLQKTSLLHTGLSPSRTKPLRCNPVPGIRILSWSEPRETQVPFLSAVQSYVSLASHSTALSLSFPIENASWDSPRITHQSVFLNKCQFPSVVFLQLLHVR